MSKKKYSPIKFQMEETIWLDHRSQSAEITNLELEADIELIENGDHVNITGNLVLSGRFLTSDEENEESLDLESSSLAEQLHFQPLRVEQKELIDGKNRGKIEKRFPIDVTVPANKIENLEDVLVSVDSLDYSISEGHRLNIEAEVSISGILTNSAEEVSVNNQEDTNLNVHDQSREFQVSASKEEAANEAIEVRQEQEGEVPEELGAEIASNTQPAIREAEAVEENPIDALFNKPDPAQEEERVGNLEEAEAEETLAAKQQDSSLNPQEESALREAASSIEDDHPVDSSAEEKVVPLFKQEMRTNIQSLPSNDNDLEVSASAEASDNAEEDRESQDENEAVSRTSSFLTQLMSGEEKEEAYTRLKMCIIQRDESIDDISERYSVSVQEILRVNQLDSAQIENGQIIYIPKN